MKEKESEESMTRIGRGFGSKMDCGMKKHLQLVIRMLQGSINLVRKLWNRKGFPQYLLNLKFYEDFLEYFNQNTFITVCTRTVLA